MLHSRDLNKKISSLHERALRITHGDKISSFQNFQKKDNSVSVNQKNVKLLGTKMFKIYNNMAPEILNDIFKLRTMSYKLSNHNSFVRRPTYSIFNGTESLSYPGLKIWDPIPHAIKQLDSL